MSKQMTETQIVAVLKQAEQGVYSVGFAKSMELAARPTTNGKVNIAVWKSLV